MAPAEQYLRVAQQLLGLILASAFLVLAAPASGASPESSYAAPVGSCAGMAAGVCVKACHSGSATAIHNPHSPQPVAKHAAASRSACHIGRSLDIQLPVARVARYELPAYLKFQSLLL